MDKGIHKEQECFLFLNLNVGEYLAACFLAKRSKDERRKWISDHYRDNIWQETLRMAIACETDDAMVQELIAIEQRNELPEGTVFSAAENWLRIIRRGFMGNRYMVSATLNYILSVEPDNIPQCIKDTLISMVEKSFVEWNQKQVKCLH